MAHLDPRRGDDVTASDVPAICGENPWNNARGVLHKKIFKITSPDTEDTLRGRRGEPVAIALFCKKTGARVDYPGYAKHATYSWFGGTVDGIATMPDGKRVVIEVKCPKQIKPELPGHYIGQVQSYMEICDMEECVFIQYKAAGPRSQEKLTMITVPRDRAYMNLRLPVLRRFWERMQYMGAYTNRVVTVLQRAWRMYLAKKALGEASRAQMLARLRCASTVGKIAGFLSRKRAANTTRSVDIAPAMGDISVEFYPKRFPSEAERPKCEPGCCFVAFQ